jgi:hypothetical protein
VNKEFRKMSESSAFGTTGGSSGKDLVQGERDKLKPSAAAAAPPRVSSGPRGRDDDYTSDGLNSGSGISLGLEDMLSRAMRQMQTELSEGFDKRFAYIETSLAKAMQAERAEKENLRQFSVPGSDPVPRVTDQGTGYSETASSHGKDNDQYDDPSLFNVHAPHEDPDLFGDVNSTGSGNRSTHEIPVDRENRCTDDEGTVDSESDGVDEIKSTVSAPLTLENFSKGKEGGSECGEK